MGSVVRVTVVVVSVTVVVAIVPVAAVVTVGGCRRSALVRVVGCALLWFLPSCLSCVVCDNAYECTRGSACVFGRMEQWPCVYVCDVPRMHAEIQRVMLQVLSGGACVQCACECVRSSSDT